MARLTRLDGPPHRMQPVDDARFGHSIFPLDTCLLKGFLVLDRSSVNGSPPPLGEEPLGEGPLGEERLDGGRLVAFTELSALCFERRFLASVFFVTPCSTTRELFGNFFPCFAPDRFAGRCAVCDCFARDFRGAALDPSVFSSRFSGPLWETSVLPFLESRFV